MDAGILENIREFNGQFWDDSSEAPHPWDPAKTIRGLSEIPGGMVKLIDAFMNRAETRDDGTKVQLKDRVFLNCEVTGIKHDPGEQMHIQFRHRGEDLVETADYVIITAPFSVLRNWRISPPFTLAKQRVGEHASSSHGWIHGAMESALNAVLLLSQWVQKAADIESTRCR